MANDLWLYGLIGEGFDGITAKSVRDDLSKMDKKSRMTARIQSPGGDVFEAVAIRSMLAQWPGGVDVQIDGLAASAASYIATVGDTVSIADGGMIMIHDPWTFALGNSEEMMKVAGTLDKVAESLVNAYVEKSGRDAEEVRGAMKAETWLTSAEAIEFGLADKKSSVAAAACHIPEVLGYKNAPAAGEVTANTEDTSAQCPGAVRRAMQIMRAKYR